VSAFKTVKSPIWLSKSPLDSFERSKMSAVNDTAWEHWYFEGVSEAGDMFVTSFARDPSYKLFGQGVLRLELRFSWANGTSFGLVEAVKNSRVEDCCGEVFGTWSSPEKTFTFRISADLKTAVVELNSPTVQGKVELESFGPSRYPDGETWPSRTASTQLSPHLHFTESIVAAEAKVDVTVAGSRLKFSGFGGHNHFWAAFDWFTIVLGWRLVRGVAGPYAFSIWHPVSKINFGVEYQSAMLLKDGKPIFTAYGPLNKTSTAATNHLIIGKKYGGAVHSEFLDPNSAWTLDFIAPETGERWWFDLEHKKLGMDVGLGAASSAAYFVEHVRGGEIDGEQYSGYAVAEQAFFPEVMGPDFMYRVWSYFLLETKATVLGSLWSVSQAVFSEGISMVTWKAFGR
jgi:hypothetical protein